MAKRSYTRLKQDRRREILETEIENLEVQLWARERDREKWTALDTDKLRASEIDDRIQAEAIEQRKRELARAEYEIELLELALANALTEMESLTPKGKAGSADATPA